MADNYVGKLLTELTEKTTATDTDLVPVAEKTGTLFRMTLAKLKEIFLGTKDISGIGALIWHSDRKEKDSAICSLRII